MAYPGARVVFHCSADKRTFVRLHYDDGIQWLRERFAELGYSYFQLIIDGELSSPWFRVDNPDLYIKAAALELRGTFKDFPSVRYEHGAESSLWVERLRSDICQLRAFCDGSRPFSASSLTALVFHTSEAARFVLARDASLALQHPLMSAYPYAASVSAYPVIKKWNDASAMMPFGGGAVTSFAVGIPYEVVRRAVPMPAYGHDVFGHLLSCSCAGSFSDNLAAGLDYSVDEGADAAAGAGDAGVGFGGAYTSASSSFAWYDADGSGGGAGADGFDKWRGPSGR